MQPIQLNLNSFLAIGASNSRQSINRVFATYTASQVQNAQVQTLDLHDYSLPLYGVDEEAENGIPEEVHKIDQIIQEADGIVLSLAEHNGSYTVAFKNVLDWLSRIDQKLWKGKPMLLLSTSPGARGGASV